LKFVGPRPTGNSSSHNFLVYEPILSLFFLHAEEKQYFFHCRKKSIKKKLFPTYLPYLFWPCNPNHRYFFLPYWDKLVVRSFMLVHNNIYIYIYIYIYIQLTYFHLIHSYFVKVIGSNSHSYSYTDLLAQILKLQTIVLLVCRVDAACQPLPPIPTWLVQCLELFVTVVYVDVVLLRV
jgi:hypothetical protein